MSILEAVMKEFVFIDFGCDPLYGEDQMDVDYPCSFATVTFQLVPTRLLNQIADRIQIGEGFKPMSAMDHYTDDTCDQNGWYDFYYGINTLNGGSGDSCIEFMVENSDSEDNERFYFIDLSPDEQEVIFNRIDEACREYLGRGCRELLVEAEEERLEAHLDEEGN